MPQHHAKVWVGGVALVQDGIQFTLARWRAYRGYEDVSSQQSKRSLMSADDDDNDNDDLELNLGKRSAKQQKSRKQQRRKSKPKVVSKNSSSDDASEPAKTGGLVEEAEVEQGLHASQAKIKVTPTWIAKGQAPEPEPEPEPERKRRASKSKAKRKSKSKSSSVGE